MNGGKIVEDESRRHAEMGTPIVALKGSFRFADELADNMTSGRIRLNLSDGHQTPYTQYRAAISR